MRDISNATHLEDNYPTQYSAIYDLKEKMVYLYLFHLSYFDYFEITFLPKDNGEVNRFVSRNPEGDYDFERISVDTHADEEESIPVTFWSTLWFKIWRFSRMNTFKFLAIILGLTLLQIVLQYLRSLQV